jgi:hypothetical protein
MPLLLWLMLPYQALPLLLLLLQDLSWLLYRLLFTVLPSAEP